MSNGRSQGGHSGWPGSQLDNRAYIASLNESNGAYMNDYGSSQSSHCSNFSKPNLYSSDQFVSSPNLPDQSWFVDSGATNHITSNLNNLSLHTPYHGADKVTIGNGKQLPMTHIGTSSLSTLLKFCLVCAKYSSCS